MKYSSRKFLIACFFSLMANAGLFSGYINEQTYLALVIAILGLYSVGNAEEGRRK